MKVRWNDESLRLRITPGELDSLTAGRAISQQIGGWQVTLAPGGADLSAQWNGADATISLSISDVVRLAEADREGIYAHDAQPRLLVEKDFPCRHPHSDDAREPETERFSPSASFIARKDATLSD